MPDPDLSALAAALLSGDLTAAVPLIDALAQAGDRRAHTVRELVGMTMAYVEDHARAASNWCHFRAMLEKNLWDALPDRDARLRRWAAVCVALEAARLREEGDDHAVYYPTPDPALGPDVAVVEVPPPAPGGAGDGDDLIDPHPPAS